MDEIAFFIGNPICLIFQSATLDEGFNHCCVSLNKMTSQEFFLLEKCRVSNPDKKRTRNPPSMIFHILIDQREKRAGKHHPHDLL
jgi:predicted nucleic acid-binding Zn ribbon protein